MKLENKFDAVILGGGASGFFAAINLAIQSKGLLKIAIVEKQNKVLQKVKASGGGRCNVTNRLTVKKQVLENYPRGQKLLQSVLEQFSTSHTVSWFQQYGIELVAEADNRMFPRSNTSQTIIDCFLQLAKQYKIEILTQMDFLNFENSELQIQLHFNNHESLLCKQLIIATGSYSLQSAIHKALSQYDIAIKKPVPSLFTFNVIDSEIKKLMGVSVANAKINIVQSKFSFQGPLLITHWGFSGPAIIKLSAWAALHLHEKDYHFKIQINWLPEINYDKLKTDFVNFRMTHGTSNIAKHNCYKLPQRLWEYLLQVSQVSLQDTYATIKKEPLVKLIHNLLQNEYEIKGKTTFKEEFVTAGGIDLQEINFNSMQLNKCKNVYAIGETIDVDGITGGFNFQNAWSTAFIAAKHIAQEYNITAK